MAYEFEPLKYATVGAVMTGAPTYSDGESITIQQPKTGALTFGNDTIVDNNRIEINPATSGYTRTIALLNALVGETNVRLVGVTGVSGNTHLTVTSWDGTYLTFSGTPFSGVSKPYSLSNSSPMDFLFALEQVSKTVQKVATFDTGYSDGFGGFFTLSNIQHLFFEEPVKCNHWGVSGYAATVVNPDDEFEYLYCDSRPGAFYLPEIGGNTEITSDSDSLRINYGFWAHDSEVDITFTSPVNIVYCLPVHDSEVEVTLSSPLAITGTPYIQGDAEMPAFDGSVSLGLAVDGEMPLFDSNGEIYLTPTITGAGLMPLFGADLSFYKNPTVSVSVELFGPEATGEINGYRNLEITGGMPFFESSGFVYPGVVIEIDGMMPYFEAAGYGRIEAKSVLLKNVQGGRNWQSSVLS